MRNHQGSDKRGKVIPVVDVAQGFAKPLTVILGQTQLLIRRIEQGRVDSPDQQLRALRSIEASAHTLRLRLSEMIERERDERE